MQSPLPERSAAPQRRCPLRFSSPHETRPVPIARSWRELPHPPGWPLLGQLPGFDARRSHLVLEQWARALGTPYRFSMGPGYHAMVFDDPELARTIGRDRPAGYTRGGRMQPVMAELGFNGLFSIEGTRWRAQRRLVMNSLNGTHLATWLPTLAAITSRLAERWRRAAVDGRALEMTHELKRYTVDVTGALAFGRDPHTLDHAGTHFGDLIQDHLEQIFPAIIRRTMTPFATWRWIKRADDRALDRAVEAVHEYARDCIAHARSALPDANPAAPRHALEAMLLQQTALALTEEDIVANVVTLLLAGEDTTAHALAWTMYYLAQDPARQDALADKARAVLGDADVAAEGEALAALDDFEHLALEALRLRPVAPLLVFEPTADVVLAGVTVPARTKLFYLARPAMMDATRFAEPAAFRPERWADARTAGEATPRAFLPFGTGTRVCPGRQLATIEMRLVLAMLVRRFRVQLACAPSSIEEINALTMLPSQLPVQLSLR